MVSTLIDAVSAEGRTAVSAGGGTPVSRGTGAGAGCGGTCDAGGAIATADAANSARLLKRRVIGLGCVDAGAPTSAVAQQEEQIPEGQACIASTGVAAR